MRKIILILLLASPCFGRGPKYNFPDPKLNDELENIYKDIAMVTKGTVRLSSVTVDTINGSSVPVITNWATYTPTLAGFGSPNPVDFRWKQIGDTVYVTGVFTSGISTAVDATISLPNSFTILYGASGLSTTQNILGGWARSVTRNTITSGDSGYLVTDGSTADRVFFTINGVNQNAFAKATGSSIVSNNDIVEINFWFIHS